jgi:two-component system, response regulator
LETYSSAATILLIEDNPDDEKLTVRALSKMGADVAIQVARDGAEAVEAISKGEGVAVPQLIMLDIKLPKLSGIEVLEKIRANERTRFVPVIMLTSSDEDLDITRAYDLGANSYVRKPVDFDEFVSAVQHLGLYWLKLNRSPDANGMG